MSTHCGRAPQHALASGPEISVAVGAAFAVLECTTEHGYELKLPMDSCIVGPHFVNALPCLAARKYAEFRFPKVPSEALDSPNNAAGLQV